MATRIFYRDRKTGHFVSFKTWNRSTSNRYVRQSVEIEEEPEQEAGEETPSEEQIIEDLETWEELFDEADEYEVDEYAGAFDTGKGKKK